MAQNNLHSTDYHDKFEASGYLKGRFDSPHRDFLPALRCYHDVFQSLPKGLKVLDYGTGPVILTTISATTKASEIILSDYAESSRHALRQWLEKDPDAFDWSPHFRRVVRDLEGKGDEEVEERQRQVRSLVKAVVHCDLTQDPPIERGYDQEYDVVISSLCLEAVAQTYAEYKQGMTKLAELVRPGGVLVIYGAELTSGPSVYLVGNQTFRSFGVATDQAVKAMREAGITDIKVEMLNTTQTMIETKWSHRFIRGIRSK